MFVTRKHSCVASFNFFLAAREHIYSKYSHAFLRRQVGGRSPPAEPLARSTCPGYPTKQSRRLIGGFVCVWSWVRWDLHIALMHTFTCPLRGHFRMPRKAAGPAFFSHSVRPPTHPPICPSTSTTEHTSPPLPSPPKEPQSNLHLTFDRNVRVNTFKRNLFDVFTRTPGLKVAHSSHTSVTRREAHLGRSQNSAFPLMPSCGGGWAVGGRS